MWTNIILVLAGMVAGFLLGRFFGPTKTQVSNIICSAQLYYLSYLIDDELYRARLNKWMKTSQAYWFSQKIAERVNSGLYLLPLDNSAELDRLLDRLEKK